MDKKYVTLFKEIARATAVSAEHVMDYDREKGDTKGLETATTMRNDFEELYSTIDNAGDEYVPTKSEIAKILVGAMVQANQVSDRVIALRKALDGYKNDVIPKLQAILDEANDDDDVKMMANEKFIIENND